MLKLEVEHRTRDNPQLEPFVDRIEHSRERFLDGGVISDFRFFDISVVSDPLPQLAFPKDFAELSEAAQMLAAKFGREHGSLYGAA